MLVCSVCATHANGKSLRSKAKNQFSLLKSNFSFPPSTAKINDIRVCEECKAEKYPQVTEVEFIDSDADFKCPAYSCGYQYNSFREQIIGYCCKEASKKIFIEGTVFLPI